MTGSFRKGTGDDPRPRPGFYGWWMVGMCSIAAALSAPGQTSGISVFIDPMMESLDLSRSAVATAYLIATLTSAVTMPRVGQLFDRLGSRVSMMIIATAFGAVIAATAGVRGFIGLMVAFFGLRLLGQGALSLVASTAVAPWFVRRRGFAIGVSTALGTSLLSLVPIASAALIRATGWRVSWLVLGAVVWIVLIPIGARAIVNRPEDIGQMPDGAPPTGNEQEALADRYGASFSRREALRTPVFWVLGGALASTGGIGTGLQFHQIALLGEQGLTPIEAAANFLPQTAGVLLTTLVVGWLSDRIGQRWILIATMAVQVAAMAAVPFISPGLLAVVYGVLLGSAGAAARTFEAAATPKLYGLRELGAIRGSLRFISVAASALGPVVLALGRDVTGSYTATLSVLLAVPIAVAVAALITSNRPPERPMTSA